MRKRFHAVAVMLPALLLAAPARGQSDAITLQKALDRPVNVDLADAPVREVFAELSRKTGVKFQIDPSALAALPYGDQTRLVVQLKNITLRKALSPMLAPQALQWSVDGGAVRISPSEALARMGRRASYDELRALGGLHARQLEPAAKSGPTLGQLRKATGSAELRLTFEVKADEKAVLARADRMLPASGAAWLDALCRDQGWTWYLWGDEIKILSRKAQVGRQLECPVSLRYREAKLAAVLLDLARKARIKLEMAPGVLDYVSADVLENFSLAVADATVADALEVIRGATGLEFVRTDEGLRVQASEELKNRAVTTRPRRRSAFFVKMSMPGPKGVEIEVFLRSDELPEAFVEAVKARKAELIEKIGGATTTQPAAPE